jgi:hypothetical protein
LCFFLYRFHLSFFRSDFSLQKGPVQDPHHPIELPIGILPEDAETYRRGSEIFRKADKNHDGTLDRSEFKRCLQMGGHEMYVVVRGIKSKRERMQRGRRGWKG